MCHVLSATGLTPLFYNTVLLSSTVRILIFSRIREIVIKYNVRKTVNPILFRLRPFWKCYLTYCWSKFKADLNPGGYSLKWPIRKGSTRKGYHFQALSTWEGWDFTCWSIVSHLAWHEIRKYLQKSDSDFSFVDSGGNSISPCWLVLFRSKTLIQIQEDKSALKLFDQQAVQPNRSNDTFFLNLHRIGYTVFLILCFMKLTQIHEDSNICVEGRRIIKSVLLLWRDTLRE